MFAVLQVVTHATEGRRCQKLLSASLSDGSHSVDSVKCMNVDVSKFIVIICLLL